MKAAHSYIVISVCLGRSVPRFQASIRSSPPVCFPLPHRLRSIGSSAYPAERKTSPPAPCRRSCRLPGLQQTSGPSDFVLLSRWRPRRWCCCPAGAWKTAWPLWRSRPAKRDRGFLRRRCRCPRKWWRTGGVLSPQWELNTEKKGRCRLNVTSSFGLVH